MSIFGVSHLAIGVSDIDKVLPFYIDVLGFRIASDFIQDIPAEDGGEIHGGRHIYRRQVWLRQGNENHAMAIALDQLLTGGAQDHRGQIYDFGIHHVGLWTDNIEAIVERARAGGHPVLSPHTAPNSSYGDAAEGLIGSVFLRDPEGNLIQCDQRIEPGQLAEWMQSGSGIRDGAVEDRQAGAVTGESLSTNT